jgi:hypothetical protein
MIFGGQPKRCAKATKSASVVITPNLLASANLPHMCQARKKLTKPMD